MHGVRQDPSVAKIALAGLVALRSSSRMRGGCVTSCRAPLLGEGGPRHSVNRTSWLPKALSFYRTTPAVCPGWDLHTGARQPLREVRRWPVCPQVATGRGHCTPPSGGMLVSVLHKNTRAHASTTEPAADRCHHGDPPDRRCEPLRPGRRSAAAGSLPAAGRDDRGCHRSAALAAGRRRDRVARLAASTSRSRPAHARADLSASPARCAVRRRGQCAGGAGASRRGHEDAPRGATSGPEDRSTTVEVSHDEGSGLRNER